jgi:hypothetical protein
MRSRRNAGHGIVLVECLVACAAVGVLIALLLVMARRDRALAWQAGALSNLREFGAITGMYGADFQDHYWTFSWRSNEVTPSEYPDLRGPFLTWRANAAAQATDILRRRAGRTDISPPSNWLPHVNYSQLVLSDYLGVEAPLRIALSPGDRHLQRWSNDPAAYERGEFLPYPIPQWVPSQVAPYKSSFQVPAAFFSPDWGYTVSPGSPDGFWDSPEYVVLGGRLTTHVRHPSNKVHLFDFAQWRAGTYDVSYIYPEARVSVLMADGGAAVRPVAQANTGSDPSFLEGILPITFTYVGAWWKPPVITPLGPRYEGAGTVTGRFSWTRRGLQGVDFDGPRAP